MVIAGAEGPKWGRSPVLDIGRREFITLLSGAAILVYLLFLVTTMSQMWAALRARSGSIHPVSLTLGKADITKGGKP
jgi:hypothetical protein